MGEPLLYPQLAEAVAYTSEKGLKSCVTTNGALLTEDKLDDLVKAGLSRLILSLQTPDERTFEFRGAGDLSFDEYKERVMRAARKVMNSGGTHLTLSFLSSPLRRLLIPIMPELQVADKSRDLRGFLRPWAVELLTGSAYEDNLPMVLKRVKRVGSFKNNGFDLTPDVRFETRIMGDWAVHAENSNVKAKFGFCPGIRENFGILWDGRFVYCCVDYDGKTSSADINDVSIEQALGSEDVQRTIRGFDSFKVVHPHCQSCLGDKNYLKSAVRQIGSIVYFKCFRNILSGDKVVALSMFFRGI
jgi:MoaA/NifB/PqqE/SkfB family radical SAM enzyme